MYLSLKLNSHIVSYPYERESGSIYNRQNGLKL